MSCYKEKCHHIDLPNETWLDILRVLSRSHLELNGISLACRRLHSLAAPLMHVRNPHWVKEMDIEGDETRQSGFSISTLSNLNVSTLLAGRFSIDIDVPPPANIVGIRTLTLRRNMTSGAIRLLRFLQANLPIKTLEFFDDGQEECAAVVPTIWAKFPAFFVHNTFESIHITHRACPREDGSVWIYPSPRKLFMHPAILLHARCVHCGTGARHLHAGPLLYWLYWRPPHWHQARIREWQRGRHLRLSIGGDDTAIFLAKFIGTLIDRFARAKKRCAFRVHFWITAWWHEHGAYPELVPARYANVQTGEQLCMEEIANEDVNALGVLMRTFRLIRRPTTTIKN